jgi:signal transduction histidine kinase
MGIFKASVQKTQGAPSERLARDPRVRELWQVNKYLWMALGFVGIYIPVAQIRHLLLIPVEYAWALFLLAFANGAARSYMGYRLGGDYGIIRRTYLYLSWAFTIIDIALIALGIAFSKGIESDLWLLYFIVIISESLYATTLQSRIISMLIAVAYISATLPWQLQTAHQRPLDYATTVAARLFFVILVGRYGRRISHNMEERNRELTLLREQVAVGEERARIAREVHDGLGHAMVSSILRLELCARLIRKAPDEAETLLKEEIPALREAWNEGRDLAFHLRPWEMEIAQEGTLSDTLRRHIGRFAERTGLVIEFEAEGDEWNLRPEAAFGLTRILQEALTNAAKHAQATSVKVLLRRSPGQKVICRIEDNGKGFDLEAARTGIGMGAMQERAVALGGTLRVESAPGKGTCITLTLSA